MAFTAARPQRRWIIPSLTVLILLLPHFSFGQHQSARIGGRVTDASGAAIAGATLTLLDQLGTPLAGTESASDGVFRLDDVPPGTYTLFAQAPPQRSDARIVVVQGVRALDVALTLAPRLNESVVVQATGEAPPVTTRMTIGGDALRQMPVRLSSRALQQALSTLPGWASEDSGVLHVRGVDDGFLFVEDGVPVYDRIDTLFGVSPDAANIGSINVLTGYIPPEYGLKSGAVVELQSSTAARTTWSGSADAALGSQALRSSRVHGGGPLGRATIGVSAAGERSDRFLDPVHPGNLHNQGGMFSVAGYAGVHLSDRDVIRAAFISGRSRYDVPHGEMQERAGQDQRQRVGQHSQSASWQRAWSDTFVFQAAAYRRHGTAVLQSSAQDSPLAADSDRQLNRFGGLAAITIHRDRHTVKAGIEAARVTLREDFSFAVTDADAAEDAEISDSARLFTIETPFRFAGSVTRNQWSLYLQDSFRATGQFTIAYGIRVDRTQLLVPAAHWSPRLGVAYAWPDRGTSLRASVNRFSQLPQPEFLLLSSSEAARALSPFAGDDEDEAGGAALEPERQTAWEIGVDQWLRGIVRLDAAVWSRHVRNYADPNVFFGTTIIFPNSVASGTARGLEFRAEMPRYRGLSAYGSYTLSKVEQVGPINGGLFLEENILDIGPGTRFTPDHDQRHVAAAGVTYHAAPRGFMATLAARYESGTPLEVEDDELDELVERPGAEMVNFETGRVKLRMIIDASMTQVLQRSRRMDTSIRIGVFNLTNRAYALNFGNPFSGTHFGSPRAFRVDLLAHLR